MKTRLFLQLACLSFILTLNHTTGQSLNSEPFKKYYIDSDSATIGSLRELEFIINASSLAYQQKLRLSDKEYKLSVYSYRFPGIPQFNQSVRFTPEYWRSIGHQPPQKSWIDANQELFGDILYEVLSRGYSNHNFNFGRH